MSKPHYEIVSARLYYGKHATKVVLLRNGHPEFHGSRKDAEEILKNSTDEMKELKKLRRLYERSY